VGNTGSFSNDLYSTLVSANTTGKYAKIWEGDLSVSNNYSMDIAYHEPTNQVNEDGTGMGNLKVSWTCDSAKNIDSGTIKFITYPGSVDGEFRLVQIAGNRAAIYHKSNHYWGRIQFRILFQNSEVRIQDFVNLGPYQTTPTAIDFWDSTVLQSGGTGSKWTETPEGIHRAGRVLVGNSTFSDETAVFEVDGGLRANFMFYQVAGNTTVSTLSTLTINMSGGNNTRRYLLQSNLTINFSTSFPANIACTYTFIFRQDGTGGKTVTWNATGPTVLWQGGVAPIIGAAANEITVITIMWTGQEYLGVKSCGFNV